MLCMLWSVSMQMPLPQVSNEALSAMLSADEAQAASTAAGLHDMRRYLEGEGDAESSQFLAVLEVHSKKKQVACFSCT